MLTSPVDCNEVFAHPSFDISTLSAMVLELGFTWCNDRRLLDLRCSSRKILWYYYTMTFRNGGLVGCLSHRKVFRRNHSLPHHSGLLPFGDIDVSCRTLLQPLVPPYSMFQGNPSPPHRPEVSFSSTSQLLRKSAKVLPKTAHVKSPDLSARRHLRCLCMVSTGHVDNYAVRIRD